MKTMLAALAGFALIGAIGATQVSAQSHRGGRSDNFRKAERVEKKQVTGHYVTVEEQVWVPGQYVTEHQDVWIEGHYDIVKEARTDCHGCVFYVSVKKWHPGHYECKEVCVYKPGYYKTVCKQVWVEDNCGTGHGHGR
jgi:hypothetical protein